MRKLQSMPQVQLVDYGCGFGYSTLAFALLVSSPILIPQGENLIRRVKQGRLSTLGVDVQPDFIEKSIVNYQAYRRHLT